MYSFVLPYLPCFKLPLPFPLSPRSPLLPYLPPLIHESFPLSISCFPSFPLAPFLPFYFPPITCTTTNMEPRAHVTPNSPLVPPLSSPHSPLILRDANRTRGRVRGSDPPLKIPSPSLCSVSLLGY